MNITIGDLINQTGFTHYTPGLQVRFGVPKGRVSVMLLLGDVDKKAPETFDAKAALNNIGWIEETRLTAAQSELAALREELARMTEGRDGLRLALDEANKIIAWQRDEKPDLARLADAERRNAESSAALQLATRLLASGLSAINPRAGLAKNVRAFLDSQRKPTESGASE